ncbi:pectinesterase [Paraclostridium bifermentans]|uniref:pectinesterase n=1 Tax=Paraclostridium bifermentans TaxID=1490 RepID=UPI0018A01986|nr:pectinesterase [Paraclostridium bifermentans]
MNSLDKAILDFINKASKRIKANFLLNLSIVGLKLLLCLIFSLLLISLFITIPYIEEICIGILVIGLIIILVYGFIKAPKKDKVALMVDSKGLDERLITSLELIGCEDNISIAQKKDTVESIKKFDIKKIKISVDKKQVLLSLGLIIMCILIMFVPSTARKEAQKIRDFDKYQKSVIEKVEKEKKEIEKSEDLSDKEKEEVKKLLEDAAKELKESEKKSEINKTLERLEKKLEDKKEKLSSEKSKEALEKSKKKLLDDFNKEKEATAKKDVNKLVNELMKKEESKPLAEAMLSGDEDAINKELAEIQNKLGSMSSSELSELSEVLKNAALEMSDEELAEALKNASNSVLDKKLDGESLSKAVSKSVNNSNGENTGSSSQQSSGSGQNQSQNKGNGQGQGSGSGQGSSSGEGQGGSGGTGGSGSGSGTGWNTGSTVGKENDLENSPGEQIYIPGRNEGNDENLTGNKNDNGNSQQIESQSGLNIGGEKVDYDKVIGDYSNSALEGANNSNLPQSLKDLIKNYFEGLN